MQLVIHTTVVNCLLSDSILGSHALQSGMLSVTKGIHGEADGCWSRPKTL